MKKISEIMDELGFDREGSPAVKEAFIKYLIKSSAGINVLTPTEKQLIKASPQTVKVLPKAELGEQLSFAFIEETQPRSGTKTKIS